MDATTSIAFGLIGLGAVVAGGLGLLMPTGDRLAAAILALIVGAGSGVIALAIGFSGRASEDQMGFERAFLTASAIGLAAVIASVAIAWRRRAR